MKTYIVVVLALLIIAGGAYFYISQNHTPGVACTQEAMICPDGSAVGRTGPNCSFAPCPGVSSDYKNGTYIVDGQPVMLTYFGNEATGDLNGDGVPDVALILTQDSGGSGTFYYVAVALKTASGYQKTNAILLGDRIAPQTTEIHNGTLVVNYADRKAGDPMTTQPSVGVSKSLKVQGTTLVSN